MWLPQECWKSFTGNATIIINDDATVAIDVTTANSNAKGITSAGYWFRIFDAAELFASNAITTDESNSEATCRYQ